MAVVRIDEHNAGERIDAGVDDRIELVLTENPTTGFRWEIERPNDVVAVESDEFVPPSEVRPGAAGERHVTFRAAAPGTARVTLRLRRAWEPPEKAEQSYDVDVRVT